MRSGGSFVPKNLCVLMTNPGAQMTPSPTVLHKVVLILV